MTRKPLLPPLPEASYLRMFFFPATVTTNDPHLDFFTGDLKVFVTNKDFVVLRDGPEVVFIAPLYDYVGFDKKTRTWSLILEDMTEVTIGRAESCGCGNSMRFYNPYKGLKIKV